MKNPRKLATFVSVLVLTAITLSTGAASADSATPTLDRINKSGTVRIGLSGGQPPFNVTSKSGAVIGLEVDLGNALASAMGVKAEFVVIAFADLLPAVESGKVDIALSGLTMTPARNRRVAFAGPYFLSGKGMLTTSATLAKADDPSDLNAAHTLVALEDSTSFQLISTLGSSVKAVSVGSYEKGTQMVLKGEAEGMVADFAACMLALLQHPNSGLESIVSPFTFEPLGAAVAGNDPLFLNLVQNYINMLEGIGLMDLLRAKWFENGDWLSELP